MDKKIIAVIVVLAVILSLLGVIIAFQMIQPKNEPVTNVTQSNTTPTDNKNATPTPEVKKPVKNATNTTEKQNNTNVKVSPDEARAIAQSVIEEPSSYAGTPKLVREAEGYTYYVPVITNGTVGGEIFIDAQTGEVIGGTA